eukprot:7379100-Prymnesium_polylepis.1
MRDDPQALGRDAQDLPVRLHVERLDPKPLQVELRVRAECCPYVHMLELVRVRIIAWVKDESTQYKEPRPSPSPGR